VNRRNADLGSRERADSHQARVEGPRAPAGRGAGEEPGAQPDDGARDAEVGTRSRGL